MTALDWIRSKATANAAMDETLYVDGATYDATCRTFKGVLPYRMRRELARASLVNTETQIETIRIFTTSTGHETGQVFYCLTTYTKRAEAA